MTVIIDKVFKHGGDVQVEFRVVGNGLHLNGNTRMMLVEYVSNMNNIEDYVMNKVFGGSSVEDWDS